MTAIVQTIKAFREGLLANWAKIALMSVGHLAVFMGFSVTTQRAVHRVASS